MPVIFWDILTEYALKRLGYPLAEQDEMDDLDLELRFSILVPLFLDANMGLQLTQG